MIETIIGIILTYFLVKFCLKKMGNEDDYSLPSDEGCCTPWYTVFDE